MIPLYGSTGVIGKTTTIDSFGKTILVARVGANAGFSYIIDGTIGVTDNTLIVKAKNQNITNYIYYYLLSKKLNDLSFGSGQPLVTGKQLSNLQLLLPDSDDEIEKISNFLYFINKRIVTQKKIIEDLIVLNKSIIHRMKSESVMSQPIKLTDIADYYNGLAHEDDVDENGYTLINSKFISSDGEIQKFCKTARFPLKKNDICLVLSDLPNGKALAKCFYVDEDNKYTLNQRIACIRSKDLLLSKYLYYYINRNSYFLKYDDGVNQTNLSKDTVTNFIIRVHNSYKKYASLLDSVNIKINNEKKILSLYIKQKQYLLNHLFI